MFNWFQKQVPPSMPFNPCIRLMNDYPFVIPIGNYREQSSTNLYSFASINLKLEAL